ncbi:hypothetical protein ABPG75_012000 [Micractinium tetrahymenae]
MALLPTAGLTAPASSAHGAADLEHRVAEYQRHLDVKQKGVDICILMDWTGSMASCIEAAKAKALEVMGAAPKVHPDAITRLAFVGYRDHCDGTDRLVVHDFVTSRGFEGLQAAVGRVVAKGGGDAAEDVAGGLEAVLGLSWSSSTRLLIHMGDCPAHGKCYHAGLNDDHPGGDPRGLVPEELLKQMVVNRIDYHFGRITSHTDVYNDSPGATAFEIHVSSVQQLVFCWTLKDPAADFKPLVLKSITSSMRRSFRSGSVSSGSSSSSAMGDLGLMPAVYTPLV